MTGTTEFELIRQYFSQELSRHDVLLGIGDDCALLTPPVNQQLVVTVDTLVDGVHFPSGTSPADIAYKAIAVNLSDLAAMGAQPAWLTLALTLPQVQPDWLRAFADSFHQTCRDYAVQLIGGDTTQGPLTITVQATGFAEPGRVMRRDRAKPGDRIYVTGCLGDAALALKILSGDENVEAAVRESCIQRLNRPVPRVAFAQAAAEHCSCAIDISDGLLADLGHILEASSCGAEIKLQQIPLSSELKACFSNHGDGGNSIDWNTVLAGGDDYELCLAVSESAEAELVKIAAGQNLALTCIGVMTDGSDLRVLDADGKLYDINKTGYRHFS